MWSVATVTTMNVIECLAAQHAWPPGLEAQGRTGIHKRSVRVNSSVTLD